MKINVSLVTRVLGTLALAAYAHAQTAGAGTITGTLADQTGAAVPRATVIVRNTDTGIDRSMSTNDSGIYFATFLQPGNYEITVSKTGFAKLVRKDLTVQVARL